MFILLLPEGLVSVDWEPCKEVFSFSPRSPQYKSVCHYSLTVHCLLSLSVSF